MTKYKLNVFRTLVYLVIFSITLVAISMAQSSTNHKIKNAVTNQGGSASQSENYKVADAIGQSSPVGQTSSADYIILSGFLAGGIDMTTAIGETYNTLIPIEFSLSQNYPNPFNPSTRITFTLPKPDQVTIAVYNTLGQKVTTLLDRKINAGIHDVQFDASDLPSGIYFYRIQVGDAPGRTGEFSQMRKMVLLK